MNTVSPKNKAKDNVLKSESENPSNNDFQNAVRELFEKSGVMENLRAYLRANLVKILNNSQPGIPILQPAQFTERLERPMQAINILIAEYFIRQEFNFTLSVFVAEIPLANMLFILSKTLMDSSTKLQNLESLHFQQSDVWSVLNCLGFQLDSGQAKDIWNLYEKSEKKLPLLLCIFKSLDKKGALLPSFVAHKSNKHKMLKNHKKGRLSRNKDKELLSELVATMAFNCKSEVDILNKKQEQMKSRENELVSELEARTARLGRLQGRLERRYLAKRRLLWEAARTLRDQHAALQRAMQALANDNRRLLLTVEQLKEQLKEALKCKNAPSQPSRIRSSHQLRTARSPQASSGQLAGSSQQASSGQHASYSQLATPLNLINNDLKKNNNTQRTDSDAQAQACRPTVSEAALRAEACRLREDNARLRALLVQRDERMQRSKVPAPACSAACTQYDPCNDGKSRNGVAYRGVQTEPWPHLQLYESALRTEDRCKVTLSRRESGKSVHVQTVNSVWRDKERADDGVCSTTSGLVQEARKKLLRLSIESEAVEQSYEQFKRRLAAAEQQRGRPAAAEEQRASCEHHESAAHHTLECPHTSFLKGSKSCRNANEVDQRRNVIEYTQTVNSLRTSKETNNYEDDYFARKIMLNSKLSEARKNKDAICSKLIPISVKPTKPKVENLIEKPLNEFRNLYNNNDVNELKSAVYTDKELVGGTLKETVIPEKAKTDVACHDVDKSSKNLTGDKRILVEVKNFEIDASNYTVKFPCRKVLASRKCAVSVENNFDSTKITSTSSIKTKIKTKVNMQQNPDLAIDEKIATLNKRDVTNVGYIAKHVDSAINQTLIHSNPNYDSDESEINSLSKKDDHRQQVHASSSSGPESVESTTINPAARLGVHQKSNHEPTENVEHERNSVESNTLDNNNKKVEDLNEAKDKQNPFSFEEMCSVFNNVETANDTGLLESPSKEEEISKVNNFESSLRIFNNLEVVKGKDEITKNNLRKPSLNNKLNEAGDGSNAKDKNETKQNNIDELNKEMTFKEDANSYKKGSNAAETPVAAIPSDVCGDNLDSKDKNAESDSYDEDFEDSKDQSSDSTISFASQSKEDTFWNE